MKFDLEGIREIQRKFFGTLYNTYQFFALYANVDGFTFKEAYIAPADRPEIDRPANARAALLHSGPVAH